MNNTFLNISVDHQRCIYEYASKLMNDIARNKVQNDSGVFCTKEIPVVGYTDRVRTDMDEIKGSINSINTDRIDAYKTVAVSNNPIGISLPKTDYDDDDNISKYYKDLRTVILDRFQEAAGSGGQGYIKFIDILATPEERAANYNIPKFDSVYTMFVKEKIPSAKVDKTQVACALETLINFDHNMKALISEADEYSSDRSKRVYLHNNSSVETFNDSVKNLAEYAFIVEEDFIMAQSLEARKYALLESVKNAHEILTALAAHNPRNIKESAMLRDINLSKIRMQLECAIYNPKSFTATNTKSIEEESIDKVFTTFEESVKYITNNTLSSYRESALNSNCIGVYVNNWHTPANTDSSINQSISILLRSFNEDTIKHDNIEKLQSTYNSLKAADKIITSRNTDGLIESVTSPAVKKAIEILPFLKKDYIYWSSVVEAKHEVTKDDISDAIEFLESDITTGIKSLKNNAISDLTDIKACNEALAESTAKTSKKDNLLININKLKCNIARNLICERYIAKLNQIKTLLPQYTKALVLSSRVISESAIAEENEKLKTFYSSVTELDNKLNDIVYRKNMGSL